MSRSEETARSSTSRRHFLKTSGTALAGTALLGAISTRAYAAENNTIKIALVGCGGRGSGTRCAGIEARPAPPSLGGGRRVRGSNQHPPARDQPMDRQAGRGAARSPLRRLDAYRKAIDTVAPAGSSSWPRRRPSGRSTWNTPSRRAATCSWRNRSPSMPPASAACSVPAKRPGEKNLKIAGGLMCRHNQPLEEAVEQIHDGLIGEVITVWAYRVHEPVGFKPKATGASASWAIKSATTATSPGSTAASCSTG